MEPAIGMGMFSVLFVDIRVLETNMSSERVAQISRIFVRFALAARFCLPLPIALASMDHPDQSLLGLAIGLTS
jgi:hypothetical protein